MLESTYGDRDHRDSDPEAAFREVIDRVFRRRGVVIIPAFALGRTQEVLYHLSALVDDGLLDPKAVFLDSPMAIKATDIYDQAESEHDEDLLELAEQHLDPLSPDRFNRCRKVDESKHLNNRKEPAVIVASSGMATGGRVVHHLKRRLADERNAVIFVGYQAGGTRGRALTGGARTVGIHGERIPVRAEILNLHGLSAHGDQEELVRWCRALPAPPQRTFLNHGEDPARKVLAATLAQEEGWGRPHLPWNRETFPW